MSERSEIRAALNAIKNGDSVAKQFGSAILRRFMAKVLAKYGDISDFTGKDETIQISAEERSDVRTCMAILATLQRADMVGLATLKAEIFCEQEGFFASAPVADEPDTFDSPEWKTVESVLIEQVEQCKTPEEIEALQLFYERARSSYAPDTPSKELRIFGGKKKAKP